MIEALQSLAIGVFTILTAIAANTLTLLGVAPAPAQETSPLPQEMRISIEENILPKSSKEADGQSPPAEPESPKAPLQDVGTPTQKDIAEQAERAVMELQQAFIPDPEVQAQLNTDVRAALVNILCRNEGGSLKTTTGSGIFIDKKGVILTNAHIAQYFLLRSHNGNPFITCSIRTGAPAELTYTARLLYISPEWVTENTTAITERNPLGTGEHDFAFLLVTGTQGGKTLPDEFPALPVTAPDIFPKHDAPVLVAGYPAGFLEGSTIERDLWPASAPAEVKEYFTFGTSTPDVFSLTGNILAQRGSSGGAVVNKETGELTGLIVTTSEAESTDDRELHAITTGYIHRRVQEALGTTFGALFSGDLSVTADSFDENVAPALRALLFNEIEGDS